MHVACHQLQNTVNLTTIAKIIIVPDIQYTACALNNKGFAINNTRIAITNKITGNTSDELTKSIYFFQLCECRLIDYIQQIMIVLQLSMKIIIVKVRLDEVSAGLSQKMCPVLIDQYNNLLFDVEESA